MQGERKKEGGRNQFSGGGRGRGEVVSFSHCRRARRKGDVVDGRAKRNPPKSWWKGRGGRKTWRIRCSGGKMENAQGKKGRKKTPCTEEGGQEGVSFSRQSVGGKRADREGIVLKGSEGQLK